MNTATFHKVKDVKPLADYRLLVRFSDGTVKQYEVSRLTVTQFDAWCWM
jgi:hypothetical protein